MVSMDLKKIQSLKSTRENIEEALRRAAESARPVISDRRRAVDVYRNFIAFLQGSGAEFTTERRKQFLFIAVYLFCPAVFIGDKMPKGFREELRDLLSLRSISIISNDTRDLMFLYTHYADFRAEVEEAYAFIAEVMRIDAPKGWWIEFEA